MEVTMYPRMISPRQQADKADHEASRQGAMRGHSNT